VQEALFAAGAAAFNTLHNSPASARQQPHACCCKQTHTAAVDGADAGGVRTGGYPKTAPVSGPLGFQRPGDWDLLWSPARTALKAVPTLRAGQLVSAVPGMYSLTKKVWAARQHAKQC
jgi:hypothetical protein